MSTADLIQFAILVMGLATIAYQLRRSKKIDAEARIEAALEEQERYLNLKTEVELVRNELRIHKESLNQERKDQSKRWEQLQNILSDIQKRITDHIKSHARE